MTDVEKKAQRKMTEILKKIKFDDMSTAKYALYWIRRHCNADGFVTFNTLMSTIGHEGIKHGEDFGWRDLDFELLSNKYGAAAIRDYKNKKTNFVLRLPPVQKLYYNYSMACFEKMHIQTEVDLFGHKGDME